MNGDKAFFDTNVLLYMYGGDAAKRDRAQILFREHAESGRLLVSTQVVQEFYVAGSKKLGMPRRAVEEAAAALLDCPLVVIDRAHIRAAIDFEVRYGISFWDALIVAAADSAGASVLYTEDLNASQRYGGVVARNPFMS